MVLVFLASLSLFFFFNDTATTEIYTLSLHDALPISRRPPFSGVWYRAECSRPCGDRKSTRLNSSHGYISYAVFCLKKKNKNQQSSNYKKKKIQVDNQNIRTQPK